MNLGVSKALGNGLRIYSKPINKIVLCRNQLSDEMVGGILSGVTERKDFKSLINIHNEFGEDSVKAII